MGNTLNHEDATTMDSDLTTPRYTEQVTTGRYRKGGHQGSGFIIGELVDAISQTRNHQYSACASVLTVHMCKDRLLSYRKCQTFDAATHIK